VAPARCLAVQVRAIEGLRVHLLYDPIDRLIVCLKERNSRGKEVMLYLLQCLPVRPARWERVLNEAALMELLAMRRRVHQGRGLVGPARRNAIIGRPPSGPPGLRRRASLILGSRPTNPARSGDSAFARQ
jgi:hypothetical protein